MLTSVLGVASKLSGMLDFLVGVLDDLGEKGWWPFPTAPLPFAAGEEEGTSGPLQDFLAGVCCGEYFAAGEAKAKFLLDFLARVGYGQDSNPEGVGEEVEEEFLLVAFSLDLSSFLTSPSFLLPYLHACKIPPKRRALCCNQWPPCMMITSDGAHKRIFLIQMWQGFY